MASNVDDLNATATGGYIDVKITRHAMTDLNYVSACEYTCVGGCVRVSEVGANG